MIPYGIIFADHIITTHFGDLVAKVCSTLLRRGTLSLQELVRSTELSTSLVKNCLLVLIQHNSVQAFAIPRPSRPGEEKKTSTFYMALLHNIIHRSRFNKFLSVARDDAELMEVENLGLENAPKKAKSSAGGASQKPKSVCVALLEGLLQHGRLTFEQLIVRETSKKGNSIGRDEVRADFNRLVHAQYVERCPRPDPVISTDPDEKPARRRGAKFVEQPPTTEQQAMTEAALSGRFIGITDTGGLETKVDVEVKNTYPGVSVGDKRKYGKLEPDSEVATATIEEEVVLWRANFEKFIHRLRQKVCSATLGKRWGPDAAIVFDAMIESSQKENVRDKNSVTSEMESILSRVAMKKGDKSITLDNLRRILDQIGCEYCQAPTGALYSIDLKGVIESSQIDEVETLIMKKYGTDACRIYRLLKNGQTYQTDKIGEITFVDKRELKKILYILLQDDYLKMKKTAPNAPGQYHNFVWEVNKRYLWENVLNDMYHGALNLTLRIAHIVEQQSVGTMTKEQTDILLRSRWILESCLLKLDDALMVFDDF